MKAMLFLLLSSCVCFGADIGAPIPVPVSLKNSNDTADMEGATLVQVYLLKNGQRIAISEETEFSVAPKAFKAVPKAFPIQTPEPPKIVPKAKANCDCQNCICEKFNGGICPCEQGKVPKQMPRTAPSNISPNVQYWLPPSSGGTCTGPNCPKP